jgi:hypothetical protein
MRFIRIGAFVVLLAGLPLLCWFGWRVHGAQDEGRESHSISRFAGIKFGLLKYHYEHGAFPPTKYRAKPGGPLHSWRVLLTRYIDEERYAKYDFSQEWNSPGNLQALGHNSDFNYFSLRDDNEVANYLAIGVGDEWPVEKPLRSYLVTEGKDQFLVFEYPDSKINWMEPRY